MANTKAFKFIIATTLYIISALALGNELSLRSEIIKQSQSTFISGNFSQLETDAQIFRSNRQRTYSGIWKLTVFYNGISHALDIREKDEAFWVSRQQLIEEWILKHPKSPSAHLAKAQFFLNRARNIAMQKSESEREKRQAYYEYVAKAYQYLEDHKKVAAIDPRWYEMVEIVARLQRWKEDRFDSLLQEALSLHSDFYQIYFAAVDYYTRDGKDGSNEIEKLARYAVEISKSSHREGMYTRIYWYAAQSEYGNFLFRDSKVHWPLMREGIDSVLADFPDIWNINSLAKLSCLAGDKEKTIELVSKIEDAPIPEAWGDIAHYEQCKSWSKFSARSNSI